MNRGFSLLEMVVTTAIVSALAAVAIPSISSWRERHIAVREMKRLQRFLERAYTTATLRETPVVVSIGSGPLSAQTRESLPLFTLSPHPLVSIQLKSKEQRELTFYPSHTTTPATVLLTTAHVSCSVVISLRGRARGECL